MASAVIANDIKKRMKLEPLRQAAKTAQKTAHKILSTMDLIVAFGPVQKSEGRPRLSNRNIRLV
jgi:hypothetical protein